MALAALEDGERLRSFIRLLLIKDSMSLGAALERGCLSDGPGLVRGSPGRSVDAIMSGLASKMSPWLAFLALASNIASNLWVAQKGEIIVYRVFSIYQLSAINDNSIFIIFCQFFANFHCRTLQNYLKRARIGQ